MLKPSKKINAHKEIDRQYKRINEILAELDFMVDKIVFWRAFYWVGIVGIILGSFSSKAFSLAGAVMVITSICFIVHYNDKVNRGMGIVEGYLGEF